MDNVLIDRSASGFDSRRWPDGGDGCWSQSFAVSLPTPRSNHSSFHYASPLPRFLHQYAPYMLQSSLSLPPPPPRRPPLLPLPPAAANKARYAMPPPALATKPASVRRTVAGEYKRKNPRPRAPRSSDEPPRVQRRRPLERATPLPPAPAVNEALDALEREVVRGFVEDLVHVLSPPPSSLPLPTFSLAKAAAV
jgi:hypothetical protein